MTSDFEPFGDRRPFRAQSTLGRGGQCQEDLLLEWLVVLLPPVVRLPGMRGGQGVDGTGQRERDPGEIGPAGEWGWQQSLPLNLEPPPGLWRMSWASLVLQLFNSGSRSEETHWGRKGSAQGKAVVFQALLGR